MFIEETKDLEELILTRVFVENIGWVEMKEEVRQLFVSLINPLSIYEFLQKVKQEDPESFSQLIAFEVKGKNKDNRIVRKVFMLHK
jgi:selenocysteine lyase/cysteine desulfurase